MSDQPIKEFLTYNGFSFTEGRVSEDFNVAYFKGKSLKFNRLVNVYFNFIHNDFGSVISLQDNDIDSNKYFTGFSLTYQDFEFNEEDNNLIIDGTDRSGNPYQVIISG